VRSTLAVRGGAVVAGRAGSKHLRMIHAQHWRPSSCRVACLAGIGRRHVRRGLAGCTATIMTAHTRPSDSRVVETRRAPRGGVVARVALHGRSDVVRWFASCADVVVAALTTATHFVVIEASRRQVRCCRVARFATLAAHHVIRRFRGGADKRSAAVAARAFVGRAFEHRVDVARLARHVTVCARQLEARGQMVEGLCGSGGDC